MISVFLFLLSCENKKEDIEKVTQNEVLPIETLENAEILYSEKGQIKVKVEAQLIERYGGEKPYSEMREGIIVTFYDSAMNETSRLTANYAIDKMSEDIMEAEDDVVVINEENEKLETEHLIWDQKKEKIYSNVYTKITTEDEIIRGEGFESNPEFSKYKIIKPIGTLTREE